MAGSSDADQPVAQIAQYQAFAVEHEGDATTGQRVFADSKLGCSKCHSIDGSRRGVGPDLAAIANKFDRQALIRAVLQPSAEIAVGYGTTTILTAEGRVIKGVLQRLTEDEVTIKDAESKLVTVPLEEIELRREDPVSMMPTGLHEQVSKEDFANLIAYLTTLRQSTRGQSQFPGEVFEIDRATTQATLQVEFASLPAWDRPVAIEPIPGRVGEYFVAELAGGISWLKREGSSESNRPVLRRDVRVGGATGLLGIACHPNFASDPRLFLKYQRLDADQIVTIVEEVTFRESDNGEPQFVDPRLLLQIPAATQDHNGGSIEFGLDGFLYIGMGDSGPQRDPQGHGQDLTTLLGKILRIDVNHSDPESPYAIPPDNPFRQTANARPEIWAYGFREPWRISFDATTGQLWVGDVGQDRFEEVAIVGAGENHGWNVFEGFSDFSDTYRQDQPSESVKYSRPVLSYPRSLGVSVTGGYVYRGQRASQLQGWYIFGDFESRRIWALQQQDRQLQRVVEIGRLPSRLVSFVEDERGELWCIGFDDGRVYRLQLEDVDVAPKRKRMIVDTSETIPVPWNFTTQTPADEHWSEIDFDDSDWQRAPGGFGTQGTPGAVVRSDWRSNDIWLRRTFQIESPLDSTDECFLRIHHDEDVEVYLNGAQITRLSGWTSGYVEVPLTSEFRQRLRSGDNTLAVHCHQNRGGQYIDCGIVVYSANK